MCLLIVNIISSNKDGKTLVQLCEEKICFYVRVTGSLQCEETNSVAQNSPIDLSLRPVGETCVRFATAGVLCCCALADLCMYCNKKGALPVN